MVPIAAVAQPVRGEPVELDYVRHVELEFEGHGVVTWFENIAEGNTFSGDRTSLADAIRHIEPCLERLRDAKPPPIAA